MTSRRKIGRPDSFIPPPEGKAKRDRSWERDQVTDEYKPVTFRRIPVELRDRINDIAGELNVVRDEVAVAFLRAGLEAYEEGSLILKTELKSGKFTLKDGG